MSDSWLVKFASTQPTKETQFRQQVEALSFDELRDFVGPSSTSTIDSFMDKAASAIEQGRQLAHEHGTEIFAKSAQEARIDQALVDTVTNLSDDEAIKLAEMLENGTDVEKIAGLMGMAGGALKSLGGMAVKHPHMAAAAGGAAIGAAAGGPGNRMGGAMAGGALGAIGSKTMPGMASKIQQGGFAAGLKGQQMMGKIAEVQALYKAAMVAKCGPYDEGVGWLTQFEGSPLLPQAIELAQHEVQVEIESIQKRQEREAMIQHDFMSDEWTKRDIIRAQKHLLELQLVAQRNGLGQQQEQAPAAPPQEQSPQAAQAPQQPPGQQQGVGGPSGVQMPMGQEKQAMNPVFKTKTASMAAQVLKTLGAHPVATAGTAGAVGALGGYAVGKHRGFNQGHGTGWDQGMKMRDAGVPTEDEFVRSLDPGNPEHHAAKFPLNKQASTALPFTNRR